MIDKIAALIEREIDKLSSLSEKDTSLSLKDIQAVELLLKLAKQINTPLEEAAPEASPDDISTEDLLNGLQTGADAGKTEYDDSSAED